MVHQMLGHRAEHDSPSMRPGIGPNDKQIYFLLEGMIKQQIANGDVGTGEDPFALGVYPVQRQVRTDAAYIVKANAVVIPGGADGDDIDVPGLFQDRHGIVDGP